MKRHTSYSESFMIDGEEVELELPVGGNINEYSFIQGRTDKGHVVIGYLVNDNNFSWEDLGDANGEVILFNDRYSHQSDIRRGLAAMGLNEHGEPDLQRILDDMTDNQMRRHGFGRTHWVDDLTDAKHNKLHAMWEKALANGDIGIKYTQPLDVYEHGSRHISLAGTRSYPDERWDVARLGGVWVPDEGAIANIDGGSYPDLSREEAAKKYAQGVIDEWNALEIGDVWGVCYGLYGKKGDQWVLIDESSCWGFAGSEHAEEALRDYSEWQVTWEE